MIKSPVRIKSVLATGAALCAFAASGSQALADETAPATSTATELASPTEPTEGTGTKIRSAKDDPTATTAGDPTATTTVAAPQEETTASSPEYVMLPPTPVHTDPTGATEIANPGEPTEGTGMKIRGAKDDAATTTAGDPTAVR